jgi:hypothetical protein
MRLLISLLLLCAVPASAATRIDVPGCLYADSLVSGQYAATVKDTHIATDRGPVDLPPGGNALYLQRAADGRRFAAVGNLDDRAYEWDGSAWSSPGMAFGVNAVIYDVRDVLRIAWGPGTPTGSQGWRYLNDVGNLVTGDESYADPANHLWEYTIRGDVRCGQGGDENGLQCLVRGRRVLVEPGVIRFIRFRRTGEELALAWVRQDTASCGLLWLSVGELETYPTYTVPGSTLPPVEPPTPPVEPPAQEPASLLDAVKAERAKVDGQPTNAQLGAMLNAVAWAHREHGWGLSKKPGGHNCPTPPPAAVLIACDILHHKPTNTLYDVFGSVEAGAFPQWGSVGPPLTPDREWLAPVRPADATEPEPDPQPIPDPQPDPAMLARLEALEARVSALEARPQPNGVPEDRVQTLIDRALASLRVVGSTSRDWSHAHKLDLQVLRR